MFSATVSCTQNSWIMDDEKVYPYWDPMGLILISISFFWVKMIHRIKKQTEKFHISKFQCYFLLKMRNHFLSFFSRFSNVKLF